MLPQGSTGKTKSCKIKFDQWAWLHQIFTEKTADYDGSIAEFIKQYSPDIHLVGRIYFHLVENKAELSSLSARTKHRPLRYKKGDAPFAFLATYSTGLNDQGESRHLPLKDALEEYRGDQEELLQLLATVHEAARRSDLLASLLNSGELFHPLSWSAKEAFTFLQEIPLYQETGGCGKHPGGDCPPDFCTLLVGMAAKGHHHAGDDIPPRTPIIPQTAASIFIR